jgi:hypothetical protein
MKLSKFFDSFSISHIPWEENQQADGLARMSVMGLSVADLSK